MKKTLLLMHDPKGAVGTHVPFHKVQFTRLQTQGPYDEVITDYAHLFYPPFFMQRIYGLLSDDGVLDITVPRAGSPASFEDPFTISYWTLQTFLFYQAGKHSIRRKEYEKALKCLFSIDIGETTPDTNGNVWIRARCTKVPMEEPCLVPGSETAASSPSSQECSKSNGSQPLT
jgi:hypothetical protein